MNPLSPEHFQAIANAKLRARKIRRAASAAALSGWSLALFALISAPFGLFGDWLSLATAIGLSLCAFNELRGSAMLKRFNPRATTLLYLNQLGLCVLILTYCGVSIYLTKHSSALKSSGSEEVDQMMSGMILPLAYGLYGLLAIGGLITTLLTAWYYRSRRAVILRFLNQTPQWIQETMRAAA